MKRYMDKGKSPEDVTTDPVEYGRGKRNVQAASQSHTHPEASKRPRIVSSEDEDQNSTPDLPVV